MPSFKKSSVRVNSRHRNFATIVYPESCPDNWLDILSSEAVPAFVSPLHDSDRYTDGDKKGEIEKPHYHVLLMYDGVKTNDQVTEFVKTFGGVGLKIVQSIRGYARYLCHLDNPDKFKYDTEKVICLGGSDYYSIITLADDKYNCIAEMIEYCEKKDIRSYQELLLYSMSNNRTWFRVLCDCGTYVISSYLQSKRQNRLIGDI